jgi:hypothetical protein
MQNSIKSTAAVLVFISLLGWFTQGDGGSWAVVYPRGFGGLIAPLGYDEGNDFVEGRTGGRIVQGVGFDV